MRYYELFQLGPAVYIPILLLSLAITVVAYGAFPVIFAKLRKTYITKKKYRGLCYGINAAVMLLFIIINGEASSGGPYLLWTWVFSSWGIKILDAKGIFTEGIFPTNTTHDITDKESQVVDIDKMSVEEAAKYLVAEQSGEKHIPKEHTYAPQKTKVKYCSQCGSPINSCTKKCTGCGKQYFRGLKSTKFSVAIIILTLVIATFSTICALQYIGYQKNTSHLENSISNLERQVKNKEAKIAKLENELSELKEDMWETWERVGFFDDHAVIVDEHSMKYHTYDCDELDLSYFWIYNIEKAKQLGYYECEKCH